MKYKVGDKVRVRSWNSMEKEYGTDSCGAIRVPCSFMPDMERFCGRTVTISRVIAGDAYRIKEDGYGWTFSSGMFEDPKVSKTPKALKAHSPITIYQEGRKVIAFDTQTGKTGVARCHPDDKFDFYYGAGLAIERLTGYKSEPESKSVAIREPKYYNGEIVCVDAVGPFTVGKVYKVKDGKFLDDDGEVHGKPYPYSTFEELNRHYISKFIELKR